MQSGARPPPIPWFRGRTVVLSEARGLLAFKPLTGRMFQSPPGTLELYLPTATLVIALAEGHGLGFQGDFASVSRSDEIVLGPIDPDDAQQIERVLCRRLGLPRLPRRVTASELTRSREWAFVVVEGRHDAAQIDTPNFEGMLLEANNLEPGRRYRVLGYYSPGTADEDGRVVPVLRPVELTPL